jgi:hypothetical protein
MGQVVDLTENIVAVADLSLTNALQEHGFDSGV